MTLGRLIGVRALWVAALAVALLLPAVASQAAGKRSVESDFEGGSDDWNAYESKLDVTKDGRGGAASLRWRYQIKQGSLVFIAKSELDPAQFTGAQGLRVAIRSNVEGPLHFNIREGDASTYQHVETVGSDWQVVRIRFDQLDMDADAGDENRRLDLDQIAEFWIVDASGYFAPQLAGPRTVWVESIALDGPTAATTSRKKTPPAPRATKPSASSKAAAGTATSAAATPAALRSDREVIASGPKSASNNLKADPTAMLDDGVFKLWYGGNRSGHGQEIYYATSTNGVDWQHQGGPVVRLGKRGEWDRGDVETPSVVKLGDIYHMYYCGREAQESGNEWSKKSAYQIGHATSKDGIRWTKDPANPVIRLGRQASNEWNWAAAAEPTVLYDPEEGVFKLWYVGINVLEGRAHAHVGLATSKNGSTFTQYPGNPVLASKPRRDSVEYNGYFTPEVIRDGDSYRMFYVSDTWNSQPSGPIRVATSKDGVRWTPGSKTVVGKQPGSWKQHGVFAPTVVLAPDGLHVWYTGFAYVTGASFGIGHTVVDPAQVR